MRLYKYVAAILVTVMTASVVSACALQRDTDDGTVPLTVYDESTSNSGEMTGWFADVIRDKFNIKLQFRTAYSEGFNAYVEQGQLGDIIVFNNESDYRNARDAGLLLDMDESGLLEEYADTISDNYPDAIDKSRLLNPDGGLYGIYGNICNRADGHEDFYDCLYIRWDLYAKLGYPEINTLEDLEPVIKDMVELASANSEADIYGISAFTSWDDTMLDLVRATAGLYGYESFGFGLYNPATDSYEPCIDSDGIYIRCLRFYNSLYRAGLFDKSSNSQTYTLTQKDYSSGRAVLGMYEYITSPYNTSARLSQGKYMMPIAAKDFSNIADEYNSYGRDDIWSISSGCVYPELCMQLINWLYTPEGIITNLYGPMDINWSYGDDGVPYITEFGYNCFADGDTYMPEGFTDTFNTGFSMFGSMTVSPDSAINNTDGISYNLTTWESVQNSQWYYDNYGKYDGLTADWNEHTGAADTNEYIENNGFTIRPATDYICDELPAEFFMVNSELSGDICTNSWLAIYADTEEEFNNAIKVMQEACTSRPTYDDIMDYYSDMLDKYRAAISRNGR